MSKIRSVAQTIRHVPGIEQADWLWNALRVPYHQLLNLGGKGVRISIGNCCSAQIPVEFSGQAAWESYEPETISTVVQWIEAHPTALFLDIGCAIGVFSLVALSASDQTEIIAWDADLPSVKATERFCRYASSDRLKLVYGFASESHQSNLSLETAIAQTQQILNAKAITGDPGTTAFVCIREDSDPAIPTHSLDGLLLGAIAPHQPILLKCDVEGAELLVLRGAKQLLQEFSPQLLLSVHPPALPGYGHTVAAVRETLEALGYQIQIIAIDHEEHWWCEKLSIQG